MRKLICCAGLVILGPGIAQADLFGFTFSDDGYTGSGALTATNDGGGLYTVTGGYFNPSYNKNQATWQLISGTGTGYDNKLVIKSGSGYLDGLGLLFQSTEQQLSPPQISIWDGTQGSSTVPVAGMTYSYNDNGTLGDGKGNLVLNAVAAPGPAPAASFLGVLGLLWRRKRR